MLMYENEIVFTLFLAIGDPSPSSGFVTTHTTEEQQERLFLKQFYQIRFKICKKNIYRIPGNYAFEKL